MMVCRSAWPPVRSPLAFWVPRVEARPGLGASHLILEAFLLSRASADQRALAWAPTALAQLLESYE